MGTESEFPSGPGPSSDSDLDRTLCPGDEGYDDAGSDESAQASAEPGANFRDERTLAPDDRVGYREDLAETTADFRDEQTLCPDDALPQPIPDPIPDGALGRRRPAKLLTDLSATAWVEEGEGLAPASAPAAPPNQDATRWEMEVPQIDEEESPDDESSFGPDGSTVAGALCPSPGDVYDVGSGTWGKPGGPPPSVQPLNPGPPQLGVDPRETLAKQLKLLCRRYPSFAPHSEFAFDRLEKLGEGGMGVVYRVLDKRLGRDAALKILRVETRSWGNRFRREIEITAKLDHPAIPAVYEAGTTATGEQYLLMRLVHGVELEDRIKAYHAEGRKPEVLRELLDDLLRTGEAVAYAHKRGVVHRDLKPANVMVGRFGEVFVMDWGLARILEDDADESLHHLEIETADSGLTLSGSVLGTPGYMPPEQARGEEVDTRADVFALGAILTAILTGDPPVDLGSSSSETVAATVSEKITLPGQRRKDVAAELNSLAAASLAPDPALRLPDASAFVGELRAYLAGEPLKVHRYSFLERLVRSARSQTGLLMGILVALLVGGGASLVGLWALNEEFEEAALERRAQEEKSKAQVAAIRQRHAEERRVEVEKERERIEEAMSLLSEARGLSEDGDPEVVEAKVKAALGLASSRFLLRSSSDVLVRVGSLEGGIELLEQSVRDYPPGYRALYRIHVLVQRQKGVEQETEALRRLLYLAKERGETNVFTHLADGLRAQRRRDLERAEASFRAALKAAPGFVEARFEHGRAAGRLAEREGDLARAEASYSAAIRAHAGRSSAWALRARLRIETGAHRAAVEDAERLLFLEPESADALALFAWAVSFEDDLERTRRAEEAALKRDPGHPMALAARSQVRLGTEDLEGAKRDLKAALAASPDPKLEAWLTKQLKALSGK